MLYVIIPQVRGFYLLTFIISKKLQSYVCLMFAVAFFLNNVQATGDKEETDENIQIETELPYYEGNTLSPTSPLISHRTHKKGSYIVLDTKIDILGVSTNFDIETDIEITPLMREIIMCESGGKHEGVWGDSSRAYGIAQFHLPTFKMFAEEAGLENADWYNQEHQLYLLKWGLENGKGNHWTCYRKLTNK